MVQIPLSPPCPPNPASPAGDAAPRAYGSRAPKLPSPASQSRSGEPLIVPFSITADLRERAGGWRFVGLQGDSADKYRPLIVNVEHRHMLTADYTVDGTNCFIERKSADDFISTITHGRENFEKEHDRMRKIIAAGGSCAVIIEANYEEMMAELSSGISSRKVSPAAVRGSLAAQVNDYGIPWIWAGNRRLAEEMAFAVLRKAWERSRQAGSRKGGR